MSDDLSGDMLAPSWPNLVKHINWINVHIGKEYVHLNKIVGKLCKFWCAVFQTRAGGRAPHMESDGQPECSWDDRACRSGGLAEIRSSHCSSVTGTV